MTEALLFSLVLVGTSVLTVLAVLMLLTAFGRQGRPRRGAPVGGGDPAFLFDGRRLIDANARGRAILQALTDSDSDGLSALLAFLGVDFPGIEGRLSALDEGQGLSMPSQKPGSSLELTAERRDGSLRVTLVDTLSDEAAVTLDRLSYRAMTDELTLMRGLIDAAPLMLWQENPSGQVTWANRAYMQRLADDSTLLSWPLPALFPAADSTVTQRVSLVDDTNADAAAWFDINRVATDAGHLVYALPADEAHQAERTKRDFVQTLTKTFATLPIGLAVFDRTRRLQVFNPALTDLTGLETEFLLSRPGIEGFLNRMRDKHVLPEPRDYRSWARRLLDIETDAPLGEFEETWALPSGQNFRVSTNPHPDGALAFLIEDITSETHMNRNVRAQMDTSQSVLNQIDAAIAVFAPNGQLMLTNTAFSQLWTLEGEDSINAVTLPEALENWQEAGDDPQLWARVGALSRPVQGEDPRVTGTMTLADGEVLTVDARRTSTGALMIAFSQDAKKKTAPEQDSRTGSRAQILRASA